MIERLLAADAALERGEPDVAERLYRQVADADARNAIALVGLAKVALARGDEVGARAQAERALGIDPDEAAARRLLDDLAAPAGTEPPEAPADTPAHAPARVGGLRGFLRRLLRRG
ncbi:MAG TPA: tetratricopeptide repeat protein [Candidatus Limnocylindrales bacterium]|nr:tetratricopeptide repeat protein [Candidatus Limnocylindrales bacterium]